MIVGISDDRLHTVQCQTSQNLAMSPQKLEKMIQEDLEKGLIPAFVVATVGTTSTTAVDNLEYAFEFEFQTLKQSNLI